MRVFFWVILILMFSSTAEAFLKPSESRAKGELAFLYEVYFTNVKISGGLALELEGTDEENIALLLEIHKEAAKLGSHKGSWSYGINKFPDACKEVLESGAVLPEDYTSKLYPKNRITFPQRPFYKMIYECRDQLNRNPNLLELYKKSFDQLYEIAESKRLQEESRRVAEIEDQKKQSEHPHYREYSDWLVRLNKLSRSNLFQVMCKDEHEFDGPLILICLNHEVGAIHNLISSLENLWADPDGRNNMDEILNILEADIEKSMKVILGKTIPDMVLVKIRFRSSLKKYFKVKGFSVYDAVAALN